MEFALLQVMGGLGLFLFGMGSITSALRALADQRLREWIKTTVNSPSRGAVTGALATTVLQSSSATTVAAVGFVGAGLLSFPESLGIIFGANIGTTIKGWIVALVGFKLDLGEILLPLILLGAIMRMIGQKTTRETGTALAGFGLIFLGIGFLQAGLSGFEGRITPESFPSDTITGRLLLVLIGLVITLITQSSSAGVATALTAVHTGTISLPQAAAMVIGMDVGTTATAALATIGGNLHARRTGYAHVIYNSMTGIMAFLLLTPYMQAVARWLPTSMERDPELVLVGFHTFFNTLGVLLVLPFTGAFARLIERLVNEEGNPLTRQLDRNLLKDPSLAVSAVTGTLWEVTTALLSELEKLLRGEEVRSPERRLNEITEAIVECRDYLGEVSASGEGAFEFHDYLADVHVLDHLYRIAERVREQQRLKRCRADDELIQMSEKLLEMSGLLRESSLPVNQACAEQIHLANRVLKTGMRDYRRLMIERTAKGEVGTSESIRMMDTARTLRRLGYHVWRIAHHLQNEEA
ncbi:MAG: Na/Pi cotransporter family protein [Planctomycetaceae bacterium]|nr:Na/Pi cotransporter family protein [Planctomycetaceae bacterium]